MMDAKYWEEYDAAKKAALKMAAKLSARETDPEPEIRLEEMSPDEAYDYCRRLEEKREESKLRYPKGKFHASIRSIDKLMASFEDPSEIAVLSDGGKGAEKIRGVLSAKRTVACDFTGRIKLARTIVRNHAPELLKTLDLIVRNRSNRAESIGELMRSGRSKMSATMQYWHDLKKLQKIFSCR